MTPLNCLKCKPRVPGGYFSLDHRLLYWSESVRCSVMSVSSVTPWTAAHQVPLSMDSSGKNPGVGSHSLLQGIFLTKGLNMGLLHCRQFLYHWSARETHVTLTSPQICIRYLLVYFKFLPSTFPWYLARHRPICYLCAEDPEQLYNMLVRTLKWEDGRATPTLMLCAYHQSCTWWSWNFEFLLPQNQRCSFFSTPS